VTEDGENEDRNEPMLAVPRWRLVWSGKALEVVPADHGRRGPEDIPVLPEVWRPNMDEKLDRRQSWRRRRLFRILNPAKRALHEKMLEGETAS
jgi:hypothetical protein